MTYRKMGQNYLEAVRIFKRGLDDQGGFEELFEHLEDVCFYAKDEDYKLIMCNEAALRLFNLTEKSEVIGKTEYDFFPKNLADPIHQDDVTVMELGRAVINRLEMIVDENGTVVSVITNKLPLLRKDGTVAGLMGTTRIVKHTDGMPESYMRHAKALDHIKRNYHLPISVKRLAEMSHLSMSQFRKTFTETFRSSPLGFIQKIRLQVACRKLSRSDMGIAEIAQGCGYCDQSYFTRQFRKQLGMTPLQYRRRYLWRR